MKEITRMPKQYRYRRDRYDRPRSPDCRHIGSLAPGSHTLRWCICLDSARTR